MIGAILGAPTVIIKIAGQALSMLIHSGPAVPGDPPLLLGVLAFVRRAVAINPDGTIAYTPATDFNGVDFFTYTVSDGASEATTTVTVTVEPADDAPVAYDDTATTDEDTPVVITVLGNDTDVDTVYLTVSDVTTPGNGTAVSIPTAPSPTHPPENFNGTDTFDYTVTDFTGDSAATVTITVNAVDDAPVANDDELATDEDSVLTINPADLVGNDEGDGLIVTIVDSPANGSLVANADGTFSYTPDENYNGTDTFTYTATNTATSNTATVTITVNPVNDDPTMAPDNPNTNAATGAVTDDLHATDVDGDTLTYEATTPLRGSRLHRQRRVHLHTQRGGPARPSPRADRPPTPSPSRFPTATAELPVRRSPSPSPPNIDNITIETPLGGSTARSRLTSRSGPTIGQDGQFHVYYSNKNYYNGESGLAANLAADDTHSFGPELTTHLHPDPGRLPVLRVQLRRRLVTCGVRSPRHRPRYSEQPRPNTHHQPRRNGSLLVGVATQHRQCRRSHHHRARRIRRHCACPGRCGDRDVAHRPPPERAFPVARQHLRLQGMHVRGDPSELALGENRSVPSFVGHARDVAHHVLDRQVLLERVLAHVLAEA